jgi:CBS domain-containing protein
MKIKDVMTRAPVVCAPGTTLAEAAAMMLEADCGLLPVVASDALVGVVTDRDMYIALATRNTRASELTVGQVAGGPVWTCVPDDDVQAVLAMMKEHRIRRVPVTGFGGTVLGVVSINDLLLAVGAKNGPAAAQVLDTLQGIGGHHHPTAHVSVA